MSQAAAVVPVSSARGRTLISDGVSEHDGLGAAARLRFVEQPQRLPLVHRIRSG
jgi:hypothetical protein